MSLPRTDPEPIEVRPSAVHGLGAFAARDLEPGDEIGVYAGRHYQRSEAEARDWDFNLTFVYGLSDGTLIDGSEGGNATRQINHSCAPNCAAVEIETDASALALVIKATRPIKSGEELFLDYWLDPGSATPDLFRCRCGAVQCRGTMLAPPEALDP